jgi:site-specific DNA-adenine methylase
MSYIFCEPFAGSAALTYFLLGAKPPISYLFFQITKS